MNYEPRAVTAPVSPLRGLSVRAVLAIVAAVSIGYSLQFNNGALHPKAIPYLYLAVSATMGMMLAGTFRLKHLTAERLLPLVVSAAIFFQLLIVITSGVGLYLKPFAPEDHLIFDGGIIATALIVSSGFAEKSWLGRFQVPALLAIYVMLGIWVIRMSPNPWIDVYVFQKESAAALAHGVNPYAITFPDIYGNSSPFYGPGLSVNGRLTFGFPYPPLSLLLASGAQWIFGDPRYAQMLCNLIGAACIAYSRPGPISTAAAAGFIFTPRGLFVLEQSWTEPIVFAGLAATVFCYCRFRRALPYVLGLFLASKQYTVMLAPALLFLLDRPFLTKKNGVFLAKMAAAGLVVSLPLILWNVPAFMHDVVMLQVYQPFRGDALSFLAIYASKGHPPPSTAWAFVVPAASYALAFWRGGKGANGFAATTAMVMMLFFAFNKQAFCNYYYFVVGALWLTAAVAAEEPETERAEAKAPAPVDAAPAAS